MIPAHIPDLADLEKQKPPKKSRAKKKPEPKPVVKEEDD
jgi:hypothetical protein